MNEAETRAEHIDPALKAAGWGVVEGSLIRREYIISPGRIEGRQQKPKPEIADYVLIYRDHKLAVIEAKAFDKPLTEGVAQAKNYAAKLQLRFAYASNGQGLYAIDMQTGTEGPLSLSKCPTPNELWAKTFAAENAWRNRFAAIPYENKGGAWQPRYYQDLAIQHTLDAVANNQSRILLTLATGTGKTAIAFQIAWKLFHARWNLQNGRTTPNPAPEPVEGHRPRILFLADRNILADQAYNAFSAFDEDALVRIAPDEIRKHNRVPKNGAVFFTIFQTFMASAGSATDGPDSIRLVSTPLPEIPLPVEETCCMYILECGDGSFYTGSTRNLRLRLQQHRVQEGAKHTAARLPVKLVHYETFTRVQDAFAREKQVQKWSHAKKLALITGNIDLLKKLSKSRSALPPPTPSVPEPVEGNFGEYPKDFFDLIIIDECHRGGANDESTWRDILEYFSPATQLGLTATPKRKDNADTYAYFGEPVYIYSLKEGINDGFLTPFRLKQISTTLDEYVYTSDDQLIEGEVEAKKLYVEKDFNRIIEIKEREAYRVKLFMSQINQNEKTLVFCATQLHALAVRDLINQIKTSPDPNYCVRVTAEDGALGEQYLREFQDNEKSIPTILTTSQKLSTGVDARNVRNIILMRPINSMIEFKQIIGRGTRLYDGKDFFTIYDFVKAHHHFQDAEWDGEPLDPEPKIERGPREGPDETYPKPKPEPPKKIKVKLANGKERTIQHMMSTTFWHPDGTPMSSTQFMESLFGLLPDLFKSENELRKLWSLPETRRRLLDRLADKGFGHDQLAEMQKIIDAENSDLYDVLTYVAYAQPPETRATRATRARPLIFNTLNANQQDFINFVLDRYVHDGVDELDQEKLPTLLTQKYQALDDAQRTLGPVPSIRSAFIDFQQYLYAPAPLNNHS